MMKYMRYLLGLALLCAQGIAMEEQGKAVGVVPTSIKMTVETRITGESEYFTYRSIREGDAPVVEKIVSRCDFKKGLPVKESDPQHTINWAQNLITRQQTVGNPYSGLVLSIAEEPVAFLTTGFMPAIGLGDGYNLEEHEAIVKTFFDLGAIRLKETTAIDPKFTKEKYKLVDDCGLGMLLPILPDVLGEENIRDALQIGISTFQTLKDKGMKLPKENTIPGHLIGLFDPKDPLIKHLKAVGFEILENPGFEKFYNKPRVMAHMKL